MSYTRAPARVPGRTDAVRLKLDDLKVVEGMGPKIEKLCHQAGIRTWRGLSKTRVTRLKQVLEAAGPRYHMHDPASWPQQAGLLADARWQRFKTLTDTLKGGRKLG